MAKANPIVGELLRSQLLALVGDMGQVLSRNAVSSEIVQERDYADGIVLDGGEVVVVDNLLQLGPVSQSAAVMQDLFQFALKPGDVILGNDPYSGGSHVQDFTVLTPFHHEREQVCCLVCRAHLPDIGGQVSGGYFPFADDVWAEGSRIPPLKIVQEGKLVSDKLDAVLINSRRPEVFRVNLQAMLAALETGRQRLEQTIAKYGQLHLRAGMCHCLQASESQLREEMAEWPRGEYQGSSILDHDARGGADLEIRASLRVGEKVVLDLSGSAPQSLGFVNSTRANTLSYALVPFYALLGGAVPANSGLLRALEIVTAEGTIVHPRFPAPVGWGPFHVGAEIVSAVAQALGKMFPERSAVLAPKFVMLLARWPQRGLSFPLHTFLQGGAAAASGVDGWGIPGPFSGATAPSVEMVESRVPMLIRQLELLPDSAGAGKWRGGFGTLAEFQFREAVILNAVLEGQAHTSEPLAGGRPGTPSGAELEGSGPILGMAWEQQVSGALTVRMGGGAGWGDSGERDAASIRLDLENELLSATAPARLYQLT